MPFLKNNGKCEKAKRYYISNKEESNQSQSLIIIHQNTFQKIDGDGNEKNKCKKKLADLLNKILRQSKTMLHGY